MKQNGFTPVLTLIIIAILGVIGYFGYKDYQSRQVPGIESGAIMTQLPNSYTNSNPVYSVKYPADWKIDSSDANLTPQKQGAILSISKDETEFRIIAFQPTSSSLKDPTICQFADSNYKGSLILGKNYTEFKSGGKTYRITSDIPMAGGSGGAMRVCLKGSDEKFSTRIGQFNIDYIIPADFDDKNIEIMNLILSTFKFAE